MKNNYLIPANSKKSQLILGVFNMVDLTVFLTGLGITVFLLLIIKLMNKFENQDIIDIAGFLGGNILKAIVSVVAIGLLFLASYITILDFSNVLHTIYFSNFDLIYILLYFIVGILIANLCGLKSIASVSTFISFFSIISIIVTFLNTQSNFDITNITPFFGIDFKTTFLSGLNNTFAIYTLVYIYFFKTLLRKGLKIWKD